MNRNRVSKTLGILLTLLLLSLAVGKISYTQGRDSVTYNLVPLSLTLVDDAGGRWQHEGGQVWLQGAHVGNYLIYRRIAFGGTDEQNTASVSMTIFYLGQTPPENITLQGSHDFNSGKYIGSVSAASHGNRHFLGKSFEGDAGANTLTVHVRLGSSTSLNEN